MIINFIISQAHSQRNFRFLISGISKEETVQLAFTCSKLTMETPEQGVKYVKS